METTLLHETHVPVSKISLGTWAFGSDRWWGHQDPQKTETVLREATRLTPLTIDTAPIYGRGKAESLVGDFLTQRGNREGITIATKVGLSWEGRKVFHCLSKERMIEEIEASRNRLKADVIDLYQVHWPDPDTPIQETAQAMHSFLEQGWIRAIGVSNYSVEQMKEFMKYAPLHALQPPYHMFRRDIEDEIIPFCQENNIAILGYSALNAGILTGKFYWDGIPIPKDFNRKDHLDLKGPRSKINERCLREIKEIADSLQKTLTQVVLKWTVHQPGITSAIVGARDQKQWQEVVGSLDWEISPETMENIRVILNERDNEIRRIS